MFVFGNLFASILLVSCIVLRKYKQIQGFREFCLLKIYLHLFRVTLNIKFANSWSDYQINWEIVMGPRVRFETWNFN